MPVVAHFLHPRACLTPLKILNAYAQAPIPEKIHTTPWCIQLLRARRRNKENGQTRLSLRPRRDRTGEKLGRGELLLSLRLTHYTHMFASNNHCALSLSSYPIGCTYMHTHSHVCSRLAHGAVTGFRRLERLSVQEYTRAERAQYKTPRHDATGAEGKSSRPAQFIMSAGDESSLL